MEKEKWEIKYENYMNGNLDKELEGLEAKYKNKEIDAKQYFKEQKRFEKIKSNLPKVENLVGLKNELNDLKTEIENEFLKRHNDKKANKANENLDKAIEKSDKENEELLIKIEEAKDKLKDKNLSDDDRISILKQIGKDESKLKANNQKYLELNAKRKKQNIVTDKSELADMDDKDLKKNYQKICMKLSRTNFYANRLLKGYDMEAIKTSDKQIKWEDRKYDLDIKKLIAKDENAKKLKDLKNTAKEQNENINSKKEIDKEQSEMEKNLGKEVSAIIAEEKQSKKVEENETSMVEVSEFDKKHPRLAKFKNFFKNLKNKMFKKDEEINDNKAEEKAEEVNDNKKEEKAETQVEEKKETKHQSFVSRMKNMEEYEIFDVADKGLDGLKEEKYAQARKTLLENKQKAGGIDEKSFKNLEAKVRQDEGNEIGD